MSVHLRAMRLRSRWVAVLLTTGACSTTSSYTPRYVAPGELTLRYNSGVQVYAGRDYLTQGPRYDALEGYVRCVPKAREHAERARGHGHAGVGLAWAGGTLGVLSLGSLGGIAYLDDQPQTAAAIMGVGVVAAAIGVSLAVASRSHRNRAHGHAIDALNYYNDAVGAVGGSCRVIEAASIGPLSFTAIDHSSP